MIRITALILFLLSSSLSASSLTLLVDTRDDIPRGEMEMDQLIQVVSLETGIMDTLFDEGHIFFNIYTVIGNGDSQNIDERADETALEYAREQGANYLLVLTPESDGASWTLYEAGDTAVVVSGYMDISETDPDKKEAERWISLGEMLAKEVVKPLALN